MPTAIETQLPSPIDILSQVEANTPRQGGTGPTPPPQKLSSDMQAAAQASAKSEMDSLVKTAPPIGGVYRDQPEALFGPIVSALLGAGVKGESLKSRAVEAMYMVLELSDWVKAGNADGAWAVERKIRELKADWKRLDQLVQSKKELHDRISQTLASTKEHDAARPKLFEQIATLRAEYQAAEMESLVALQQVKVAESHRRAI